MAKTNTKLIREQQRSLPQIISSKDHMKNNRTKNILKDEKLQGCRVDECTCW